MKKKNDKKVERFEMKLTQNHKEKLNRLAQKLGMSLADYLTMVGLSARIDIRLGVDPVLTQLKEARDMLDDDLITMEEFETIKKAIFKNEGYKALKSRGAHV